MHTDEPANVVLEYQPPSHGFSFSDRQVKLLGSAERALRWTWFLLIVWAAMQYVSLSSPSFLAWFVGVTVGLAWLIVFATFAAASFTRRRRLAGVVIRGLLGTLFAVVALPSTRADWPFDFAFWMSRPFLESTADRLEAGQSVMTPRFCGLILITDVSRAPNGTPFLFMSYSPSGWTGLVRHPTTGKVDHVNSNNGGPGMLTDRWELVDED